MKTYIQAVFFANMVLAALNVVVGVLAFSPNNAASAVGNMAVAMIAQSYLPEAQ